MSFREEDRQKSSCSSRGLGVAAAAIGVGVGAALYYFFNKQRDNSHDEGSSSNWSNEEQNLDSSCDSDSYTTISENTTTDTSMDSSQTDDELDETDTYITQEHSVCNGHNHSSNTSYESSVITVNSETDSDTDSSSSSSCYMESCTHSNIVKGDYSIQSTSMINCEDSLDTSDANINSSFEEQTEWDVTDSSTDIPSIAGPSSLSFFRSVLTPLRFNKKASEEAEMLKAKAFRQRSWSLEECSICFDIILKDQEVTSLPCTHHFHSKCIAPWLNEQQTCPNCRKQAL